MLKTGAHPARLTRVMRSARDGSTSGDEIMGRRIHAFTAANASTHRPELDGGS